MFKYRGLYGKTAPEVIGYNHIHFTFPFMASTSFGGDFTGLYNYADLRLCAPFYRTRMHTTSVLELKRNQDDMTDCFGASTNGAVPYPNLTEHGICENRWCKYA